MFWTIYCIVTLAALYLIMIEALQSPYMDLGNTIKSVVACLIPGINIVVLFLTALNLLSKAWVKRADYR